MESLIKKRIKRILRESFVPTIEQINSFINTFGQDDYEVSMENNIDYLQQVAISNGENPTDFPNFEEIAISLGYVWLDKYEIWVKKNTYFNNSQDKEIFEYLIR